VLGRPTAAWGGVFLFTAIYGIAVTERSQSPRESYSSAVSGF